MSQQSVYNLLKSDTSKWFTIKEIARALKQTTGTTTANLRRLVKLDDVEVKMVKQEYGYNLNHYKIRNMPGETI